MANIGKNIRKIRRARGLTQDELAEKLFITRQTISGWENGRTQPDIDTLTQLAGVFDVSIERLIYGKGKPYFHFAVNFNPQKGIQDCVNLGSIIAAVISYAKWGSVGWAILHGMLNWFYVIYYVIRY